MKKLIAMILFLFLCLSMWGCSSNATYTNPTKKSSGANSSTSNQKPSSNKDNTTSTSIDPNGFSSLDEFVGVYVAMQTGTATKEQLYKIYPEKYWSQVADFDQVYSDFLTDADITKDSLKTQYGADYKVTYQVIDSEVVNDYSKENIDKNQNQEFKDIYGIDIKERCDYHITISITISGSITEKTVRSSIYIKQIGNKWYG